MNFFGLTSLGPQNSIKSNLLRALNISNFTDEEFAAAFDEVDTQRVGWLESHQVAFVFTRVYGTEPPEVEIASFLNRFPLDGKIEKGAFLANISQVRAETGRIEAASSTEFSSSLEYKDDLHKHKRLQYGPTEKYRKDQLESHKIGWRASTDIEKEMDSAPRKNCEETKYAAEMIKSGIYF